MTGPSSLEGCRRYGASPQRSAGWVRLAVWGARALGALGVVLFLAGAPWPAAAAQPGDAASVEVLIGVLAGRTEMIGAAEASAPGQDVSGAASLRDAAQRRLEAGGLSLDLEVRLQLALAGLDEVLWRVDGDGVEREPGGAGPAPPGRRIVRVAPESQAHEVPSVPERRVRRVEAVTVPERRIARVSVTEPSREVRRVEAEAGRTPRRGGERWAVPIASPRVTSRFGPRIHPITGERGRMHNGLDYGAPTGTAVLATASGEVLLAGWCGRGPGNCVVIDHGGGWRSHYFHLSRWRVRAGQRVAQGDRIGDVGSTGASTGPHLHFELRREGRPYDPETLLGRPVR